MSDSRWDSEVYSDEPALVSSPQNLAWRYALVQSLVTNATVAGDMLFVSWGVGTLTLAGATIPAQYNRVVYPGQVAQLDKGVVDTNPFQALPIDAWSGQFSVDVEPFSDGVVQSQPAIQAPYQVDHTELVDGLSPTYSAAARIGLSAGVNTDVLTLAPTAGYVVRLNRVEIDGEATTAVRALVSLLRRTGTTVGAGSTTPAAVAHDSNDVASGARVTAFSTPPTALGALVGAVRECDLVLPVMSGAPTQQTNRIVWDWAALPARKRPTVRSALGPPLFAINLNGLAATPGGFLDVSVEWTEDPT